MPDRNTTHYHLTYKQGFSSSIVRQSEAITGADAALRLLEEIAAHFVKLGCRIAKYSRGIRIYDCKNENQSDQSFEVHECKDLECGLTPTESEYGHWSKSDRDRYLLALRQRNLFP